MHQKPLYENWIHPWHITPVFGYFTDLGHVNGKYLVANYRDGTTVAQIREKKDIIADNSGQTIMVMWGYSALAGVVFRLAGKISEYHLMLTHILLDSASAVFVALIVYQITRLRLPAVLSGVLYAFWPTYVQLCVKLEPNYIYPFFLLSSLYFALQGVISHRLRYFFISAIIIGIGLNFRLDNLFYLFILIVFLWFYLWGRGFNKKPLFLISVTGIMLFIPSLLMAPWVVRNYKIYNKLVIGSPNAGLVMHFGLEEYPCLYKNAVFHIRDDRDGIAFAESLGWKNNPDRGKHWMDDMNGIEFNSVMMRHLLSVISKDPVKYAAHLLYRAFYIVSYHDIFSSKWILRHPHDAKEHDLLTSQVVIQQAPQWSQVALEVVEGRIDIQDREREILATRWPELTLLIWPKPLLWGGELIDEILFVLFLFGILSAFRMPNGLIPLSIMIGIVISRSVTLIGEAGTIKYIYSLHVVYPIYLGILMSMLERKKFLIFY